MNDKDLLINPVMLKCEYCVNPLGVDIPSPRLSWRLESLERDQVQSAYQILVASSKEQLDNDIADKWDSGKVVSSQTVNIPYEGKVLRSSERCYWKVRCWDKDSNVSLSTEEAFFEMGLLDKTDWVGQWIGPRKVLSAPLLRKEFSMPKMIKRARAYICGLGYYELYLNGKKVGDRVLDPAPTYYHNDQPYELGSRCLYITYDLTDLITDEQNALGVILGNGWYSTEADIPDSPSGRAPFGDRPVLIFQMLIEYMDGETEWIVSDSSWKYSDGPIIYNDYSNGESYDARLEKTGWTLWGYNDDNWEYASIIKNPPKGVLRSQLMPPSEVVKIIEPVEILNPREGQYVFDFGQNFSGWVRLSVQGPEGTRITLHHGARVYSDGMLDARSNRDARQLDTYILKGEGMEEWEPRFTLHGFRYVEVKGFPGIPTLNSLKGYHVRTAAESVGSFTCSNPLINQIHSNARWTLMSSLQGFPQDAAERNERVGWLGDPVPEDYILNFDTANFWIKWAEDMKDVQKLDGEMPVIAPLYWRNTIDSYENFLPAWSSTYAIVVWQVYQYYDDEKILVDHYENLKNLVNYLNSKSIEYIIDVGLGDHMEPQPDGKCSFSPNNTPVGLTSTAYFFLDTWIVASIAKKLGKNDEEKCYSKMAKDIKNAFNMKYFDTETNNYGTGSQTSNSIPLYFGMVPEDRTDAVVKNIIMNVVEQHNGHIFTGMLGTGAIAEVLPKYGAGETMYDIATRTTFPSWGHMISKEATTMFETWNGDPEERLSYNMKIYVGIERYFYKHLGGIYTTKPGFENVNIRPCVVGDLKYVDTALDTVRGKVSLRWDWDGKILIMRVVIPPNMTADIDIPKMRMESVSIAEGDNAIWQSGKQIFNVEGIMMCTEQPNYIRVSTGSGLYEFKIKEQVKG